MVQGSFALHFPREVVGPDGGYTHAVLTPTFFLFCFSSDLDAVHLSGGFEAEASSLRDGVAFHVNQVSTCSYSITANGN